MEVLRRHGIRSAMINGGGDVEVMGGRAGRPWRVGIRHPRREGALLGTLELTDGFVVARATMSATSSAMAGATTHPRPPQRLSCGRPAAGIAGGVELEALNGLSLAVMVRGPAWGGHGLRTGPVSRR